MPVTTKKIDGYRVRTPGGVKAKSTTKKKAQRQANLLRAIDHGWEPTGEKARDLRKKSTKGSKPFTEKELSQGYRKL